MSAFSTFSRPDREHDEPLELTAVSRLIWRLRASVQSGLDAIYELRTLNSQLAIELNKLRDDRVEVSNRVARSEARVAELEAQLEARPKHLGEIPTFFLIQELKARDELGSVGDWMTPCQVVAMARARGVKGVPTMKTSTAKVAPRRSARLAVKDEGWN